MYKNAIACSCLNYFVVILVTAYINGRCNAGSLLDVGSFRGKRVGPAPLKEVFVEIVETLLSFTKESPEDLLKLIPPDNSVPFDYKCE